jgi:hypothetical protein
MYLTALGKVVPMAGGTVIGIVVAVLYWSSYAARTCPLGQTSVKVECVQTAVGTFTQLPAFAWAGAAVGFGVGLIVALLGPKAG